MDSVIQEFIKWTIIGLGAGMLTLGVTIFVLKTRPSRLKIGNIVEADWADQKAGTVSLNVDGSRKVYIPGEAVELVVTQVENFLGDYIDEKAAYIRKAMHYAEMRLKGFAGEVFDAVIYSFPEDMTDKEREDRVKFLGLLRRGLIMEVAAFLKVSFLNNGFYDMRHKGPDGHWYQNPEWATFIDRQADALVRESRHYIGDKIPYSWGLNGREILRLAWKDDTGVEDHIREMAEEIYLAAWENQHVAKLKKAQYQKARSELVDSLRRGFLPEDKGAA